MAAATQAGHTTHDSSHSGRTSTTWQQLLRQDTQHMTVAIQAGLAPHGSSYSGGHVCTYYMATDTKSRNAQQSSIYSGGTCTTWRQLIRQDMYHMIAVTQAGHVLHDSSYSGRTRTAWQRLLRQDMYHVKNLHLPYSVTSVEGTFKERYCFNAVDAKALHAHADLSSNRKANFKAKWQIKQNQRWHFVRHFHLLG